MVKVRLAAVIAVTILLYQWTEAYNNGCGPQNRCTCANFIMDCRDCGLAYFPTGTPDNMRALYLNGNNISKITQIGENCELQTLVMTDNDLEELNYDAFDNLPNLKTLQLSGNRISSIMEDVFEWNPKKLEVLYLDGNRLQFIQQFLFYNLEELTDLYLQNNFITFVHPHAFSQLRNLRNLRLDGNKLYTFNPIWIEKLQANAFTMLRFDENPWVCDCAMNTTYKWFSKYKSFWFRHLTEDYPITCVSPPQLENMRLDYITKKEPNAMCDMPRIIGISRPITVDEGRDILLRCIPNFSLYPVPTISWTAPNKDIFRLDTCHYADGITVHQSGDLLIHNLSSIDNGTYTCNASNVLGYFTASTTITIKLLRRYVTPRMKLRLNVTAEQPARNITVVNRRSCPLQCQCIARHIDCSGDGTTTRRNLLLSIPVDAISINLANNHITKLAPYDFHNFVDLEELQLDDNKISTIDSRAFSHLKHLTTLTLQRNQLSDIAPGTFSSMYKLNVLILDKNKLTNLTSGMFKGLSSLQWLYLRNNFIVSISEDAFAHLQNIKFIHLESNRITMLHPSTVKTLFNMMGYPKIRKIFVDDNNIQCDCKMEDMRQFIQNQTLEIYRRENLFGNGIVCSNPPDWADMELSSIMESLTCNTSFGDLDKSLKTDDYSNYPSLYVVLVIAAVIIIIIIFAIVLWTRYSRNKRKEMLVSI